MKYSKVNLFCRSLLFSCFSITAISLYSTVVACSILLPLRIRHQMIRGFLRFYMRALDRICHINYEIEGLANIPANANAIVMSKHQSTWETFFLPTLFHDPAPIAKRELLWIPFFGWGLAAAGPITINRNNKTSAMQQIITKGKQCLAAGRWILVFPEGTRVPSGVVGHYKLGGARLAAASGYPVIPVAHNAGRFWPRRKFIKNPGTIKVVIGPAIESKDRQPEEILSLVKNWIEETMKRIDINH